jgi:hypothetical protein
MNKIYLTIIFMAFGGLSLADDGSGQSGNVITPPPTTTRGGGVGFSDTIKGQTAPEGTGGTGNSPQQ